MKKRGILFTVMAVVMALCLMFSATACGEGGVQKKKTIAVVAKGESHAFWQSVKRGAEAAGAEKGYTVTFRGPASESAKDLPSQQEMVQTALSDNPAAMVLATIGTGFVDLLTQAYNKHIPVIEFDSGVWADDVKALNDKHMNPIVASVASDNRAAAAIAAEKLFAAIKEDIAAKTTTDKYVIGIIQHDQTQTGIDRAGGFEDKMKELIAADPTTAGKAEIVKEVKPGDADNAYKAALEALAARDNNRGVDAIFMSNEGVVKQVYDAIKAAGTKYDAIKFYGFDAGTKQIEWMKATTGPKLIGAVAQDSYNIGYNAVKEAIRAAEKYTLGIPGTEWNSDNVDQMIEDGFVYEG